MRVFKVKAFTRWAKSQRISDKTLKKAVAEIRNGLVDASLGRGLCKKRIPSSGRGKRGGARTIVACKAKNHTFFIFGYAKNEQENIDRTELKALKQYATSLFELADEQIEKLLSRKDLFEIN